MTPRKVLIGSTVRQKPAILQEFLLSLAELERPDLQVDCLFVDNNDSVESSRLLKEFSMTGATVFLCADKPIETYNCTEETHFWNDRLIWQIAAYKDFILQHARENSYSHVLLVDSDLVLHPATLKQLLAANCDIISEIFWTAWAPGMGKLPQVWLTGQYSYHIGGNHVPDEERTRQTTAVINNLKLPGVYEVGGLGACTLISANAVARGVTYSRLPNLDYWGEDRHFCVRAVALGFKLFVDTHYPAYHIYRESDLPGVAAYKEKNRRGQRKARDNKITLSMVVRNEADRYLRRVLEHARQYIDAAVIIDDASTDNTAEICRVTLAGIPLKLITRAESGFANEFLLRRQQWQETIDTNPDWILSLDADEIFEDRMLTEIPALINQTDFDWIAFRLYDFWDENHFREDRFWQAHNYHRPMLVRYVPGFTYKWQETAQHCGRLPCNISELPGAPSSIRLKHFGWAHPRDREVKFKRYLELDPEGRCGIMEQYLFIMDRNPNLVRWEE